MHPVRKQRLIAVLAIVIGVGIASALTFIALGENMNHFYMPADIDQGKAEVGQKLRVGGLVKEGSVRRSDESLAVSFVLVGDLTMAGPEVTVKYEGILPDLFREGQGIIAIGELDESGQVFADEVLAKHDETYMPAEVKAAIEAAGHPADKAY